MTTLPGPGTLAGMWPAARQDGQTAAEYLGVLVLVAVVVGVLAASDVGAEVRTGIERTICRIAQADPCGAEQEPEDTRPACINSAVSHRIESQANANVRWVKLERSLGMEHRLVELPDGRFQGSIRLDTGLGLAPGLKKKLPLDLQHKLAKGGTITFEAQSREQVEQLMNGLRSAAGKTAKWLATRGIPGCIPCAETEPPDFYRDVSLPAVESVGLDSGSETRVGLSTETAGRTRSKPKDGKPGWGERNGAGAGLEVTAQDRTGVTLQTSGPNAGGHTIAYETESSFAGNVSLGPLAKQAFGGEVKGKTGMAFQVDKHGNPTKLTLTLTGQGALSAEQSDRLKLGRTFAEVAGSVGIEDTSEASAGKGYELTTEIDLTDPRLRRAAIVALTGRDPDTGEQVDPAAAARELGQALGASSRMGLREFSHASTTQGAEVDLGIGGAGGSYTAGGETTTGYWLRDPATGRWTHHPRCPGAPGGAVVDDPPR